MIDAKLVSIHLSVYFRLSKFLEPINDAHIEYMKKIPYARAVGSIIYAIICSRSNVAHGVGVVSRLIGNPGKEHWRSVNGY